MNNGALLLLSSSLRFHPAEDPGNPLPSFHVHVTKADSDGIHLNINAHGCDLDGLTHLSQALLTVCTDPNFARVTINPEDTE